VKGIMVMDHVSYHLSKAGWPPSVCLRTPHHSMVA
jgi:hypothetical protein